MRAATRLHVLDLVEDVVDLAAPGELLLDRPGHQVRVEGGHDGVDGQPVLGRRLDQADVPQPGERHVERPGDGRGGEGQDVDRRLHLLDLLLVLDPEALLLVDDEQAQVAEGHVLGEKPVRADDDVDRALPQVRDDGLACSAFDWSRVRAATRTGKRTIRAEKVLKCWLARTVVGQSTATCLPSMTALKAARMATSVLP